MTEKSTHLKFIDYPISSVIRVTPDQVPHLKKLNLFTVGDILRHFPTRYGGTSEAQYIKDLMVGQSATIYGRIGKLKTGKSFKSKMAMAEGVVTDNTGNIKVIWLHQPYIAKLIQEGSLVKVTGKVTKRGETNGMMNPEIESVGTLPDQIGRNLFAGSETPIEHFSPVYPETKGVTSKWIYHTLQRIFKNPLFESIEDPVPADILKKYNLPALKTSLVWIHTPQKESDAQVARKRFAFEEVFYIQIKNQQVRAMAEKEKAYIIEPSKETLGEFTSRFPFALTTSQQKSIKDILNDFKKGTPMSRLLEGDVGSGKTAVAATTAYGVVTTRPKGKDSKTQNFGNLQVAYMAPTEILAKQHFESFIQYFKHMPISIGFISGTGCRKFPSKVNQGGWTDISRSQLLKWVEGGEIAILIGTHALIQKTVKFKDLAYVIIDEQHRFGTAQRQKLARKHDVVPHLLSMTATPIPRTLALTLYGDLDLSLIDQMPTGRKPIITEIITEPKRDATYEKIKKELAEGRQVYVICPRIEEADPDKEQALNVKSVVEEAKRLKQKIFQEWNIDILHSKMKPKEKDAVMQSFERKEIDILVATSVVEVGVNVPNATIILIEGAERFGLSQLHQLRGRVIRSNHQAYCYVLSDSKSDKTVERLKALNTAKNGFELSEMDLKLRGTGELYGGKQWGVNDIGMEAIKNIKMVEAARAEAQKLVKEDSTLSKYPILKKTIDSKREIHFE
ncbi:MAG: ATP-dependent DNA helicase RecG [bacterium]